MQISFNIHTVNCYFVVYINTIAYYYYVDTPTPRGGGPVASALDLYKLIASIPGGLSPQAIPAPLT